MHSRIVELNEICRRIAPCKMKFDIRHFGMNFGPNFLQKPSNCPRIGLIE